MNRCQNCGHDTTEYDPHEIIEQLLDEMTKIAPMRGWDKDLMARARACVRNNPMVQIANLPSGGFADMIPLRAKTLELRTLGFDELRAPVWTTKRGEKQILEIVKRAERMALPLPHEEKDWLRKMLDQYGFMANLSTLRHLLRR